jgi:hypothetical protein
VAAVAAFLTRPYGELYARACERYAVDPAAALDDDYLAAQFRVGAGVVATRAERKEREKEKEKQEATTDPFAATRKAGAALRAAMGQ